MCQTAALSKPVLYASLGVLLWLIGLMLLFPEAVDVSMFGLQYLVVTQMGWFYMLSMVLFFGFSFWLMCGRLGQVRLGGQEARPAYPFWSWLALLLTAGVGIGLVYHAPAEVLQHLTRPLPAVSNTGAAAELAIVLTFLHWGFEPWAMYAVFAAGIAYFAYQYQQPLRVCTVLYPLLGEAAQGPIGVFINIIALISTVIGIATTFVGSAVQLSKGLTYSGLSSDTLPVRLILIGLLALCVTAITLRGIKHGIRPLCNFHLGLSGLLALFILVAGPTLFLLDALLDNLGGYLQQLPQLSFSTDAYRSSTWAEDSTMYYWAWWLAWAPFVGLFMARISWGRTIRQMVAVITFLPAGISMVWLSIVSNTALHGELTHALSIGQQNAENLSLTTYYILHLLPYPALSSGVLTLLVTSYCIGATAAAVTVMDLLSTEPAAPTRWGPPLWACLAAALAVVLLLGGGLTAVRPIAILAGFPFCVLLLVMCVGLGRMARYTIRMQPVSLEQADISRLFEEPDEVEIAWHPAETHGMATFDQAQLPDSAYRGER